MKILRALMALCVLGLVAACSEGTMPQLTGGSVTGRFVDSEVAGLGYECGGSDTRMYTNGAGEFTCKVGDEVRFYIGQLFLGSVTATSDLDVVSPLTLVGGSLNEYIQIAAGGIGETPSLEFLMSVYMATLLQSLDEDGDPENGIVIPEDAALLFPVAMSWEPDDEGEGQDPPEEVFGALLDEVFGALEDAEVELMDPEYAFMHLMEETEKLLYGRYTGSVADDEETVQLDLFIFRRVGGGEEEEDEGMQVRMITSAEESYKPVQIQPDSLLHDWEGSLFSLDYSLDGIVIRFYDVVALEENEDLLEEGGDLSDLEGYVLEVVLLQRSSPPPDVDFLAIAEFLAMLPNGSEVPEGLEEFEYPRVSISASDEGEENEGGFEVYGHTQKVSVYGYVDGHEIQGGHGMLSSMGPDTLVYTGRVLYWYYVGEGEEAEELMTWGDFTVTIQTSGDATIDVEGDDGSGFTGSYDVDSAGVFMDY